MKKYTFDTENRLEDEALFGNELTEMGYTVGGRRKAKNAPPVLTNKKFEEDNYVFDPNNEFKFHHQPS